MIVARIKLVTSQLESCTDGNVDSDYPVPRAEPLQCPDWNGFRVHKHVLINILHFNFPVLRVWGERLQNYKQKVSWRNKMKSSFMCEKTKIQFRNVMFFFLNKSVLSQQILQRRLRLKVWQLNGWAVIDASAHWLVNECVEACLKVGEEEKLQFFLGTVWKSFFFPFPSERSLVFQDHLNTSLSNKHITIM